MTGVVSDWPAQLTGVSFPCVSVNEISHQPPRVLLVQETPPFGLEVAVLDGEIALQDLAEGREPDRLCNQQPAHPVEFPVVGVDPCQQVRVAFLTLRAVAGVWMLYPEPAFRHVLLEVALEEYGAEVSQVLHDRPRRMSEERPTTKTRRPC